MIREKIMPRIMDRYMASDNFSKIRREILKDVKGMTLEIGFGTGHNIKYYHNDIELHTVDSNPGMKHIAEKKIKDSHIEVIYHTLNGEKLPFDDASFDSAVSTWTLCSIYDLDSALKEIYRVLKQNGKFYFLDHGLAPQKNLQKLQHFFNPAWRMVADGCNLDRNIRTYLENNGFEFDKYKEFYMEKMPKIGGYLYTGIAVKNGSLE